MLGFVQGCLPCRYGPVGRIAQPWDAAEEAALFQLVRLKKSGCADLIAQAKASPDLHAQIDALSDAYESLYPSLLALSVEIDA